MLRSVRGSTGVLVLAFAAAAASGPVHAATDTVHHGTVLDRVTVVDVRTGKLTRGRAIVIADGRIVRIARAGSVKASGGARRIDGRGRFVVPGYNDMHAHNLNTDSPSTSLPLMLASGVTGFRQMAGAPALLAARGAGKPLLPSRSPALLAMPGTLLAGAPYADPAAVAAEVSRQKALGADFIKVVDLPPPAFAAAIDAARAADLPIAGHLPLSVDAREALRRGMGSIEHLGPGIGLLLNCSRDESAIRAMLAAAPASAGPNFHEEPTQVRRMLVNPMLAAPPQSFALMRRVLATYDAERCRAFAADVAASETWMVPTLTRLEAMNHGNTRDLRENPSLADVPAPTLALWRDVGNEFDQRLTADQRKTLVDLFEAQLRLAKLFDEAGVKMLAGTDFGGGWILPGSSLHREFDLLARAGLSPLRILQMATLQPATFLHRETRMGTVEAGRSADLVMLEGNPMASVANLHRIAAVVRAGHYLDRQELDAISTEARSALP